MRLLPYAVRRDRAARIAFLLCAAMAACFVAASVRIAARPPGWPVLTLRATAPLGAEPSAVAVDSVSHRIYVALGAADADADAPGGSVVAVLDEESGATLVTVGVGHWPRALAVHPTAGRVYVANYGSADVSVIDGDANTVVATIPWPHPQGVGVDPGTGRVYVSSGGGLGERGSVWVIDGVALAVVAVHPTGQDAGGLAVHPTTHRVYVANPGSNTVSVLDGPTGALIATTSVGPYPTAIAVDPVLDRAFVVNTGLGIDAHNTVSILDGATGALLRTVVVGSQPTGIAIDAASHRVYVADPHDERLVVLDGASGAVLWATTMGGGPLGVAVASSRHRVGVVARTARTLAVWRSSD